MRLNRSVNGGRRIGVNGGHRSVNGGRRSINDRGVRWRISVRCGDHQRVSRDLVAPLPARSQRLLADLFVVAACDLARPPCQLVDRAICLARLPTHLFAAVARSLGVEVAQVPARPPRLLDLASEYILSLQYPALSPLKIVFRRQCRRHRSIISADRSAFSAWDFLDCCLSVGVERGGVGPSGVGERGREGGDDDVSDLHDLQRGQHRQYIR